MNDSEFIQKLQKIARNQAKLDKVKWLPDELHPVALVLARHTFWALLLGSAVTASIEYWLRL